jgi:hypothetical protein
MPLNICTRITYLSAFSQVFTYLPVLTEGKQLLKAEDACVLRDPALHSFHSLCVANGIPLTHLGPMGKVWECGVVQVVQNVANLTAEAHPLNNLPSAGAAAVGEVIYLPVYDARPGTATRGVVAAVELMVRAHCADAMVVANVISALAGIMDALGLALSVPLNQQPQAAEQTPTSISHQSGGKTTRNGARAVASQLSSSAGSIGSYSGGLTRTASVRMLV